MSVSRPKPDAVVAVPTARCSVVSDATYMGSFCQTRGSPPIPRTTAWYHCRSTTARRSVERSPAGMSGPGGCSSTVHRRFLDQTGQNSIGCKGTKALSPSTGNNGRCGSRMRLPATMLPIRSSLTWPPHSVASIADPNTVRSAVRCFRGCLNVWSTSGERAPCVPRARVRPVQSRSCARSLATPCRETLRE